MDANFVLFCFVFLGALLLISFDALSSYHDDGPGFGAIDLWDPIHSDLLAPFDEWAEDSGFTYVDGLFVDEDGNTWTPESLFAYMLEVTGQA